MLCAALQIAVFVKYYNVLTKHGGTLLHLQMALFRSGLQRRRGQYLLLYEYTLRMYQTTIKIYTFL